MRSPLFLSITGFVLLFLTAAALAPSSCADYPDGRRCDGLIYVLVVLAGVALLVTGMLAARWLWSARRHRSTRVD